MTKAQAAAQGQRYLCRLAYVKLFVRVNCVDTHILAPPSVVFDTADCRPIDKKALDFSADLDFVVRATRPRTSYLVYLASPYTQVGLQVEIPGFVC